MYDKLIKRLRDWPRVCAQYDGSVDQLHDEAADAIEKLSKYANTIMQLKSEGWYLQQSKYRDGYAAIATMPFPEPSKEEI